MRPDRTIALCSSVAACRWVERGHQGIRQLRERRTHEPTRLGADAGDRRICERPPSADDENVQFTLLGRWLHLQHRKWSLNFRVPCTSSNPQTALGTPDSDRIRKISMSQLEFPLARLKAMLDEFPPTAAALPVLWLSSPIAFWKCRRAISP